ncbi:MAG: DUF1015 domain-containing protein [Candidatus Latescibacterota bacterium]
MKNSESLQYTTHSKGFVMPTIRPFRALRYNPNTAGDLRDLVAPPYDIIYDEWRDRLYNRNPFNIIRLIKTRDEAAPGEASDKYLRAADYLEEWTEKGALRLDERPRLYVCSDTFEIDGETRSRIGFIALLRLEEFGNGIHPHERTLSGPKIDRLHLVKATQTNLSQIFGIYRDPDGGIQECLRLVIAQDTDIDFVDEQGVRRRFWAVEEPRIIEAIQSGMQNRDIIIADGHHRYETALAYRQLMEPNRTSDDEPFDYVSMYFSSVDDPGMLILPTHRKIGGLEGFNAAEFFRELGQSFEVERPVRGDLHEIMRRMQEDSAETSVFAIYIGGEFGLIRLKNPSTPKRLDVEVLHEDIIERILGVTREDIAAERYLHFSKSAEHVIEDVDQGKDQIGILMNGIRPEEMFPRVVNGDRLPQKSTYFYPKTVSGLVMYRIRAESLG